MVPAKAVSCGGVNYFANRLYGLEYHVSHFRSGFESMWSFAGCLDAAVVSVVGGYDVLPRV